MVHISKIPVVLSCGFKAAICILSRANITSHRETKSYRLFIEAPEDSGSLDLTF